MAPDQDGAPGLASAVACESARLRLRFLDAADQQLYCDLFTDADTMRHIAPPLTPARARRSFQLALERTASRPAADLFLTLELKADARRVGLVSVQRIDAIRRCAEAGIMLLPAYRRMGLATEAMDCALRWACSVLQLAEIWLATRHDHEAMHRLCARLQSSPPIAAGQTADGELQRRRWRPDVARIDLSSDEMDPF